MVRASFHTCLYRSTRGRLFFLLRHCAPIDVCNAFSRSRGHRASRVTDLVAFTRGLRSQQYRIKIHSRYSSIFPAILVDIRSWWSSRFSIAFATLESVASSTSYTTNGHSISFVSFKIQIVRVITTQNENVNRNFDSIYRCNLSR